MQFKVRRQTIIGDIRWADPYGDNWEWFSETNSSSSSSRVVIFYMDDGTNLFPEY